MGLHSAQSALTAQLLLSQLLSIHTAGLLCQPVSWSEFLGSIEIARALRGDSRIYQPPLTVYLEAQSPLRSLKHSHRCATHCSIILCGGPYLRTMELSQGLDGPKFNLNTINLNTPFPEPGALPCQGPCAELLSNPCPPLCWPQPRATLLPILQGGVGILSVPWSLVPFLKGSSLPHCSVYLSDMDVLVRVHICSLNPDVSHSMPIYANSRV